MTEKEDFEKVQDALQKKSDKEKLDKSKMDIDNRSIFTIRDTIVKRSRESQDER